jgi:hypothetical protein
VTKKRSGRFAKCVFVKKKGESPPPRGGVGIFGISGFYCLPIRRAAFSDFIQAKGRLIRPRALSGSFWLKVLTSKLQTQTQLFTLRLDGDLN